MRSSVRRSRHEQRQLRGVRYGMSVRRTLYQRNVRVRARIRAMRHSEDGARQLRRSYLGQCELRWLRHALPRHGAGLQRRHVCRSLLRSRFQRLRGQLRRSRVEQTALRPLQCDLRRKPHLHRRSMRMSFGHRRLRRRLRRSDDGPKQLRNMRDAMHVGTGLRIRAMPVRPKGSAHGERARPLQAQSPCSIERLNRAPTGGVSYAAPTPPTAKVSA